MMNKKPTHISPTPTELAILGALWQIGQGTVREIHQALNNSTGQSTTLKMVQVMTEKKLLIRDESVRPQVYSPALPQEQTQLQMIDELILRAFGGSASELVLRAASAERISAKELAEIKKLIEKAKTK